MYFCLHLGSPLREIFTAQYIIANPHTGKSLKKDRTRLTESLLNLPPCSLSAPSKLTHRLAQQTKISLRYQRGNQNPYIEEEQTTQWPNEKVQRTNNDLQNIHIKLKIE
jgi:hypothetical protein